MSNGIDQIIVEVYTSFPLPPDQIVCTPDASAEFAKRVNARLPEGQQADIATINKRLLNLRRRGQDKGGLPRRWREYNGRDNQKIDQTEKMTFTLARRASPTAHAA